MSQGGVRHAGQAEAVAEGQAVEEVVELPAHRQGWKGQRHPEAHREQDHGGEARSAWSRRGIMRSF